jgi:hypothetical protein
LCDLRRFRDGGIVERRHATETKIESPVGEFSLIEWAEGDLEYGWVPDFALINVDPSLIEFIRVEHQSNIDPRHLGFSDLQLEALHAKGQFNFGSWGAFRGDVLDAGVKVGECDDARCQEECDCHYCFHLLLAQRCGAPTARQRRSVSPLVSHHFRMSLWITQLQNASTPNNKQNTLRIYTHIQKNNRVAQYRCPVFFSISLAVVQSAHIEKSQLTAVIRGRLCFATNGRMAKNHIGYGAKNGIANMVRTMVATVSKNHFLC